MKRALVVGRAAGVMKDLSAAWEFEPYDQVLVVGRMGIVYPVAFGHWVTFHSNLLEKWAGERRALGLSPARNYWGGTYQGRDLYPEQPGPDPFHRIATFGGSSGFMAVQIAHDRLGCERIVLAGMPMEAEASRAVNTLQGDEKPGDPWEEANTYWETWEEHQEWLRPIVRSFSGRTARVFGVPTREWLA